MSDAEIIIGNYKLLNCLATGSQSQVWEAMEVASTERYAMKLLLPEAHKNLEQKTALKHEANVAKSLDHPNIIKFHSIVINKEYAYYMMELFRAPNLKIQIQTELPSLQMRLKRMVELMGAALGHMHEKGWLHKDVKPENILFSKSSELRLIDFSLAGKIVSGFGKFFSGSRNAVQGTRTYMAPEQIRGRSAVPQTDIYSFGISIFEILTGKPPFVGSSPNDLLKRHLSVPAPPPSSYNPNVTPEMDRMILRMLAKKPENRHKNMNELLAEFRNVNMFKEAVELDAAKDDSQEKDYVLGERRDSRSDALRSETQKQNPVAAAPAAVPARPAAPPAGARPPQPAAPPATAQTMVAAPRPGQAPPQSRPPQPGGPPGQAPRPGAPAGSPPPAGGPPRPVPGAPQPAPGQPPRPPAGPGQPTSVPQRPGSPPAAQPAGAPRPAAGGPAPGGAPPRPAAASPQPGAAAPRPVATNPPRPVGGPQPGGPAPRPTAPQPAAAPPRPAAGPPPGAAPQRPASPPPRPAAPPQKAPAPPANIDEDLPLLDDFKIL